MLEPDELLSAQPPLKRGACREQLFSTGGIISWILCRRGDMPLLTKVIFSFVFNGLRGAETWVQTTVSEISRRTRIGERRIRARITWLCDRGFMERRRRPGEVNWYRSAHPDDWPPDLGPPPSPGPDEIDDYS